MKWHLLTGEYPPRCGGVGDYTANLAQALAASGDDVDVWVGEAGEWPSSPVRVHSLPDRFGPGSRTMLGAAFERAPGVALLQYVPNALGSRGANVAFCRWLGGRRSKGEDIRVMFHEPYMYFSLRRPWLNALALAQRVMAATLIKASTQVYYSTDRWADYLGPFGATGAVTLPIPSSLGSAADTARITDFRTAFTRISGPVIGHFGTFGADVANELYPIVQELSRRRAINLALVGENSQRFTDRVRADSRANVEVVATGRLPVKDAAAALAACDLLVQPFPDGATTRRTSLMAGLGLGVPVVTSRGFLTEPFWAESGAAALATAGDPREMATAIERLIDAPASRVELGARGRTVYASRLSMDVTVSRLRRPIESVA